MRTIVFIPARFSSSRLPGKPLKLIHGKSMIQRVYEQVKKAKRVDRVVVATDDKKIVDHIHSFGGEVILTFENHQSGTNRCLEAIQHLKTEYDLLINVQGDEPFIDPNQIDQLQAFMEREKMEIGTMVKPFLHNQDLWNSNTVKVVFNSKNEALYFSRSVIPHVRDIPEIDWINKYTFYQHIGIYAFRNTVFNHISSINSGALEQTEKLEQLNWLDHGLSIGIQKTSGQSISVDTEDDLSKAIAHAKQNRL